MMNNLQVSFANPHDGWVTLTIIYSNATTVMRISYAYESLANLTNTLYQVLLNQGDVSSRFWSLGLGKYETEVEVELGRAGQSFTPVDWLAETEQYEMRFYKTAYIVNMELHKYPHFGSSISTREQLLFISGNYEDVCLPFWRALQSLQGCFQNQK